MQTEAEWAHAEAIAAKREKRLKRLRAFYLFGVAVLTLVIAAFIAEAFFQHTNFSPEQLLVAAAPVACVALNLGGRALETGQSFETLEVVRLYIARRDPRWEPLMFGKLRKEREGFVGSVLEIIGGAAT